jgi:hypothetical protein
LDRIGKKKVLVERKALGKALDWRGRRKSVQINTGVDQTSLEGHRISGAGCFPLLEMRREGGPANRVALSPMLVFETAMRQAYSPKKDRGL